jgi:hypothetical protein
LTLLFIARMLSIVTSGGVTPGSVPSAYCSFSPSALMMWLSPNSCMAIAEMSKEMASSREIEMVGVMLGRLALDTGSHLPYSERLTMARVSFNSLFMYIPDAWLGAGWRLPENGERPEKLRQTKPRL